MYIRNTSYMTSMRLGFGWMDGLRILLSWVRSKLDLMLISLSSVSIEADFNGSKSGWMRFSVRVTVFQTHQLG